MQSVDNYYKIMGIEPGASAQDIKVRYRALAREFHPDLATNNPNALRTFMSITRAYRTLGDPERRGIYDSDQRLRLQVDLQKDKLDDLEQEADSALMGGQLTKVRQICEAMLQIDSTHVRALHMLGDALAGQNHPKEALDAYRLALSLSPGATLQAKVSRLEALRPSVMEAASAGVRPAAKPMERRPSLVSRLFLRRS